MSRRPIGDRPQTAAERQARRRAKVVTFTPADKAALDAAAAAMGKDSATVVAALVEAWLTESRPTPAPVTAAQIDAATTMEQRRRALLDWLAAILNQVPDGTALDRIERRLAIIADLPQSRSAASTPASPLRAT